MKKTFALLAALLLVAGFVSAGFASPAAAEDMTFTGWVADEACAKDYAKSSTADHKGCATGCLKKGAVALSTPDGLHLLDITSEKALEHLGMEVVVTGTLNADTNTIAVTSIAASTPTE